MLKIQRHTKQQPIYSTNTKPIMWELTLTAVGTLDEIRWLEKKIDLISVRK